eukprot:753915-Hanusia_phi.AAC.27
MDDANVCQPRLSDSTWKVSARYNEHFKSIFMLQHSVCRKRYGEKARWRQRSPQDFQGLCDCEDGHFLNGTVCVQNLPEIAEERGARGEGKAAGEGISEATVHEHEMEAKKVLDRMAESNTDSRDEQGGCKCQAGYTSDVTGGKKCVGGSDKLCSKAFGENVEFDGNNHCRCMRFKPSLDHPCLLAILFCHLILIHLSEVSSSSATPVSWAPAQHALRSAWACTRDLTGRTVFGERKGGEEVRGACGDRWSLELTTGAATTDT